MWMEAAAALDTTSTQPTPALSSFLSQRKLGGYVQTLAQNEKLRTLGDLAMSRVSEAALTLYGLSRFQIR